MKFAANWLQQEKNVTKDRKIVIKTIFVNTKLQFAIWYLNQLLTILEIYNTTKYCINTEFDFKIRTF